MEIRIGQYILPGIYAGLGNVTQGLNGWNIGLGSDITLPNLLYYNQLGINLGNNLENYLTAALLQNSNLGAGEQSEENLLINDLSNLTLEDLGIYSIIVQGDTNGDGEVDINDVIQMKATAIGQKLEGQDKLSGIYLDAADIDEDGKSATLKDIAMLIDSMLE